MRTKRLLLVSAIVAVIGFLPLMAQREVSYRIVLDDKEVPKEVLAGFQHFEEQLGIASGAQACNILR